MSTETPTPSQIGRYRIVRSLGTGAMGTVYLARDESLGRLVALKTFHRVAGSDPHDRELQRKRLLREAKAAGTLSHPNVVTIYDVLERDETVYIAMEYVEGVSLEKRLASGGPFPWDEAVEILTQVASALDHLHDRGIVHRDVKPANILITTGGRVKITDFGVARPDDPTQTQETSVFGTPQYMAPEQIRGEAPDARTDVFAIGILAYEMLTGARPFSGNTVAEVTHAILYEPTPPPEERHPSVTPTLSRILERSLSKEPTERFRSAGQMIRALRQAIGLGSGSIGVPPSPEELDTAATAALGPRPDRLPDSPASRRRSLLRFSVLLVLLLGALGAAWIYFDLGTDAAADRAREESYLQLVTEGRRLMAEGDPEAALVLFDAAGGISTAHRDELSRLREAAIRQAEEEGIEIRVSEARRALEEGRYDQVVATARTLLGTERGRGRALEILDEVGAALSGEREAASGPSVARGEATPGPDAGPDEVAAEGDRSNAGRARLVVHLETQAPSGVLTVYADASQVLLEPFDFYERTRWFRKEPRPGELTREVWVDSSVENLLVLVAREGEPAEAVRLGPPLTAGETVRIEVSVPARGRARAGIV